MVGARRFRVVFAAALLLVAAGTATAGIRSVDGAETAGRHATVGAAAPLSFERVAVVIDGTHGSDRPATTDPGRILGLATITLGAATLATRRRGPGDVGTNPSVRPLRRTVGLRAPPDRRFA